MELTQEQGIVIEQALNMLRETLGVHETIRALMSMGTQLFFLNAKKGNIEKEEAIKDYMRVQKLLIDMTIELAYMED